MKNNLLLLLTLVAVSVSGSISAMQYSKDLLDAAKEEQTSRSNNLKKYINLGLGLGIGAIAKYNADQFALENKNKQCITSIKFANAYRNFTIASCLASGYFLYSSISDFTGKKLAIVNNDESK